MFNKKIFIYLQFFLLLFTSCRELVFSEFPEMEPVPVINAVLVPGDSVHVNISQTASIDTNNIEYINNATVIFYEDSNYLETLEYIDNGLYRGNSIVKENKTYQCEIDIPYFGTFKCSTKVPVPEKIIDSELLEQANIDEEGFTYPSMDVLFTNTPGNDQYFDAKIILYNGDNIIDAYVMDHTDPVLLNEGFPLFLFSNEIIDDTLYTITLNFTTWSMSGSQGSLETDLYPMIVELRTVDESYHKYVRQLYLYNLGRYPEFSLASTLAYPLYSNIDNAYGIFTSYAVHATDTIYPSTGWNNYE